MTSISRLGSSPVLRSSPETQPATRSQASSQPTFGGGSQTSPLKNMFSADSFDKSASKAGGSQQMVQQLQELLKMLSQLLEKMGGKDSSADGAQGGGSPSAGGAQGGGSPSAGGGSPSAGGAQGGGSPSAGGAQGGGSPAASGGSPSADGTQGGDSSMDASPEGEQVPDLGDSSSAQGASPQTSQPQPQPLENKSQNTSSSESSPVSGAQGTTSSGKSDAKDFLAKSAAAKDQTYPAIAHDSPGLGEKNKGLWDAAHKAGATDQEASIMVAQQMQEGANDPSKSGGAENFGPMNLNRGLLKDFGGMKEGDLAKLNENSGGKYTPEALEANAKASLTAMRNMGTERYLDHVRGGGTGYEHPNDDTKRFGNSIGNAANHVLEDFKKDPTSISKDWRQAANIPGI